MPTIQPSTQNIALLMDAWVSQFALHGRMEDRIQRQELRFARRLLNEAARYGDDAEGFYREVRPSFLSVAGVCLSVHDDLEKSFVFELGSALKAFHSAVQDNPELTLDAQKEILGRPANRFLGF